MRFVQVLDCTFSVFASPGGRGWGEDGRHSVNSMIFSETQPPVCSFLTPCLSVSVQYRTSDHSFQFSSSCCFFYFLFEVYQMIVSVFNSSEKF